jgi:phospholipase C
MTPEVDNFHLDDERLGYVDDLSIFDLLSVFGVDWVYAEGNVGFIRLFDRFRLDTQNVIPYADYHGLGKEGTFLDRFASERLPAVTFIDPRFTDIPPTADANDDLPPADVLDGQALVKQVYELLRSNPAWPRTLFIVTYDEHGGFFDHVPPPGTKKAADSSPQPRVHADEGADHLGVRVPTFLISPWVEAGQVVSTPLDHTAIVRTITERFVSTAHAAGSFGPRAAASTSLFGTLTRDTPRTDEPVLPTVPAGKGGTHLPVPIESDDFSTGMRLLGVAPSLRARLLD